MPAPEVIVVAVHAWEFSDKSEPLVRPVPAMELTSQWWIDLPEVVEPYHRDDALPAARTLRRSVAEGPTVIRIRARAPTGVGGGDLPRAEWSLESLEEGFVALGLDLELVKSSLDPHSLPKLRHGALRVPFFTLTDTYRVAMPVAQSLLTAIPVALNVLLEVEHARLVIRSDEAPGPTDYHSIEPHRVWRSYFGSAAGLTAPLALRALTTLDRGAREMRARRSQLEQHLFDLKGRSSSVEEMGNEHVLDASQELLQMVTATGKTHDRLMESCDIAPQPPGDSSSEEEAPYVRVLSELRRHDHRFARARDDCRETTRMAGNVAAMLGLLEQQSQTRRGALLQRTLTLITAVVLLPGLVAAIYGANVRLPGEQTTAGTMVLLCAMGAFGFATVWLIGVADRGAPEVGMIRPRTQGVLLACSVVLTLAGVTIGVT